MQLSQVEFDLRRLLDDIALMFHVQASSRGLAFRYEPSTDLPGSVFSDEGKLRQILMNLLGNAIKFTKRGEVLFVAEGALSPSGAEFRFRASVRDTGPGIAPEEADRLFQPFGQTAAGIESRVGTGLGLAISRECARLLGGDVTFFSPEGGGSCFTLELPLTPCEDVGEILPSSSPRPVVSLKGGSPEMKVLVVDDSRTNRWLVRKMLEDVGVTIIEAANGAEALAAFIEHRPRLILTDISMPIMDGLEAIRRIRAEEGGGGTRIVALTARAFEDERRNILAAGADGYLRKPFTFSDLLTIVGEHLTLECVLADEVPHGIAGSRVVPPREEFDRLPAEVKTELREAVTAADMERILRALDVMEATDSVAAAWLRQLAREFRYEAMLDLLPGADGN